MQISVRHASKSDKSMILDFCTNTFSWGDYIADVWDIWYGEKNGNLLVADSRNGPVGMAHVAICLAKTDAWLEGLRVHPDYRRLGTASKLLLEMLSYAENQGAIQALAVVSHENTASRRMLEKHGFGPVSEWSYFSTAKKVIAAAAPASIRFASEGDIDQIWLYLSSSEIYEKCARRYVQAWRWYSLDRTSLERLVAQQAVIITGDPVDGLAIVNTAGYWNRKGVIQVVYMDSQSETATKHMLSFVTNIFAAGAYERMHVLCHKDLKGPIGLEMEESEHFLVYRKKLLPAM